MCVTTTYEYLPIILLNSLLMEYFSHYSYSLIFAKRKGEVVESSCGWGDFFEAKQKPVNNISSSQGHGSEAEYRLGSREGVDEMR